MVVNSSRRVLGRLVVGFLIACAVGRAGAASAAELKLATRDGVTIYGEVSEAIGPPRGTLLLFHQAGSNQHEYDPTVPRLTALGFRTIAIDQRSGGDLFGHPNRTARALGRDAGYLAALPDLEAALATAAGDGVARPVIAVGSSYSAALVFLLAAAHPREITALASFSPGEYLGRDALVKQAAAKVGAPIFVTSSSDASEIAAARSILAASSATSKTQFVPKHGVHGASTLRADANREGAMENWVAFKNFLDIVAPARAK